MTQQRTGGQTHDVAAAATVDCLRVRVMSASCDATRKVRKVGTDAICAGIHQMVTLEKRSCL